MANNLWFLAAMMMGILTLLLLYVWQPYWSLKSRVWARLYRQQLTADDKVEISLLDQLLLRLVASKFLRGDYKELDNALDATGKSPSQARQHYILVCWLLPILALVSALFLANLMAGFVAFIAVFLLSRRAVRSAGASAERQQNREAIELCQMTRMLMEAGLSPERSLKLISHQARELMPLLVRRIDRFNAVMELGADRSIALDELGRNRNLVVLRHYVSLMKQSGLMGGGVSDGLEQIIQAANYEERTKLKEVTNKVGAKMTIIMMVFMLPSLFILLGGPPVISILEALQR